MGIRCPHCQSRRSLVVDSGRQGDDDGYQLRRRECKGCKKRYNTREYVVAPNVIKPTNLKRLKEKLARMRRTLDDIDRVLLKKRD